jgi:DNA-binding response OmpR family regulator
MRHFRWFQSPRCRRVDCAVLSPTPGVQLAAFGLESDRRRGAKVPERRADYRNNTVPKRILIVDDEPEIAELLAKCCEGPDREVKACTSSLEALAWLTSTPTDVLVTDIVMPQLDGLSLVREARLHCPQLEAIVMTGYSSSYSMEDVLRAGASDLLLKPIRMPEFRARVELALGRRQTLDTLEARRQALQTMSTEMIDGLQRELKDALDRPPGPNKPTRK